MKDQPPPYGMNPPQMGQPQIIIPLTFGPDPQGMVCPSCHTQILTRVDKESTAKTHLFALLLCIIFCPLVCIPYCTDSCMASNHYCPRCGAYLGAYDR